MILHNKNYTVTIIKTRNKKIYLSKAAQCGCAR
jgi:hypothetical protein